MIVRQLRPALVLFLLFTILLGIVYPLLITGIAQLAFPVQANGNFIIRDGKVVGSALIGQPFSSPKYFWGRPSATSPVPYNAMASSGSNLGPSNPALRDAVKARVDALRAADPGNAQPVPVDLVTASGSGLDPDISVAAAYYQVPRVARARSLSEQDVRGLIASHTEPRQFWIFGEPHINVLSLNLALNDLSAGAAPQQTAPSPLPDFDRRLAAWAMLALFFSIFVITVVPLGRFMWRVYSGQQHVLAPVSGPAERRLLAFLGVTADDEMDWKTFSVALMVFSAVSIVFLFLLQEVQNLLPLNPAGAGPVPWDLSLNTAVSFATNTNWQAYIPETTVSYTTQMAGLAVQNFLSAAVGMAVLIGLIYGLTRKSSSTIGNFWVLLIRSVMILIPISIIIALVLVSQGTVQTFAGPVTVPLLDPVKDATGTLVATQTIPLGPAASQVAIKLLGTNGGGFFNTNSAHPFENPSPFAGFIEVVAILLIPVSLCYTFGRFTGAGRKGVSILFAMTILFFPLLGVALYAESRPNPALAGIGVDQSPSVIQPGGNMEGKEVRFGVPPSALFAVVTTVTSCGAVNAMHDSLAPLGGFVTMFNMMLGEVVYGGVGSGLYGMLVFVIIAMFIAGLMVGRTPEYLGKKIEPYEMKISTIIILVPIFLILIGTAVAVSVDPGKAAVFNPGPHGFSEILYAFSSGSQNNGSAFAGLSANNPFYNLALAACMFIGRYAVAVLTLALAGSFVVKKVVPESGGTLRDHRPLFIIWLVFVVLIIGALSFFPVLALGPVVEQLMHAAGSVIHG
jgi:K+-transporting ATPase ATPase A chain